MIILLKLINYLQKQQKFVRETFKNFLEKFYFENSSNLGLNRAQKFILKNGSNICWQKSGSVRARAGLPEESLIPIQAR